MRTTMSALCWLVAVAAGLVAAPTAWAADHIVDEAGYLEFAADLRSDPELLDAVAGVAASDAADRAGLSEQTRNRLADGLGGALRKASESQRFDEAWDESHRRSHALWFGGDEVPDEVQFDVAPLVAQALDLNPGPPVSLSESEQTLVTVAPTPPGFRLLASTPDWKVIALIAAGAGALLCVAFARRRANATIWVGAGAVIVAAVTYAGSRMTLPPIADRAEAGFGDALVDVLVDRAVDSLDRQSLLVAGAGVVVMLIGLAARLATGRRGGP